MANNRVTAGRDDQGDAQINVIIRDLQLFTQGEIIALTLNIDANLRENPPLGTPVATGWARANWIPSIAEPTLLENIKEPTPAQISARAAIADAGRNDVLAWTLEDGPIFVANSVPYIGPLNDGHSPQSPPGFIQFAIEKAIKETYSAGASKAARNRRASAARANKARPV